MPADTLQTESSAYDEREIIVVKDETVIHFLVILWMYDIMDVRYLRVVVGE